MPKHTYAKLISETQVEFPLINGPTGDDINYFVNVPKLLEDGYKPYKSTSQPQDGKIYSPRYMDDGDKIVQTWVEFIPPQQEEPTESPEEKREKLYRIITDGWEAELAYKTRKGYPVEELKAIEDKIDVAREHIKQMCPDLEVNDAG